MEDYKILRKLGSGNFATVYLALHIPTSTQVALKLIDKNKLTSPKIRQKVDREISNMKRLRHANIVEIFESFETPQHAVIVMEYMPRGELFDYVWERRGLGETEAREMFSQIVEAVEYCHKNSLVHRDLKLENILLDRDCHPKLADFGFSREVSPTSALSTYCGSPLYASPEMIFGKPYRGPEVDVWSLGVVLYCVLTASMPFDDSNPTKFLQAVQKGQYVQPASASESARNLISRMLDPNPKTRATVADVLIHPWIRVDRRRKSMNPQQPQQPQPQHQQLPRSRKVNMCYSHSEAAEIASTIMKMSGLTPTSPLSPVTLAVPRCTCRCHEGGGVCGGGEGRAPAVAAGGSGGVTDRKDSVLSPSRCDCCSCASTLQPASPTSMTMMHRNRSNCSSGYGSETGGSCLFGPRVSVTYQEISPPPSSASSRRRSQPSPRRESFLPRSSLAGLPARQHSEDLVFV